MIKKLHINNYALFKNVEIDFTFLSQLSFSSFFEKLNNQFDFTEVEVLNSSISFKKIKMLGELLFKMIIPEGYSINFFD